MEGTTPIRLAPLSLGSDNTGWTVDLVAGFSRGLGGPRPELLRILYLTASARSDLRVDEEMRRVKAGVRATTHRNLVHMEHLPAATGSDLLDGLTRLRPHIVHFSGHADEDVLEFDGGGDDFGPGKPIRAEVFARALRAVDDPPRLVVLNACKSQVQLAGLLKVVPLAIGMSDSVGDTDAMAFAARFYAALAEGQSVLSAYRLAKMQMEMSGLLDAEIPVLEHVPTVDPATAVLVVPSPPDPEAHGEGNQILFTNSISASTFHGPVAIGRDINLSQGPPGSHSS